MSQPSTVSTWVRSLSDVFDAGLLLIDGEGDLSLANARARSLLHRDPDALRREWPALREHIEGQITPDRWNTGGEDMEVELPVDGESRHFLLEVVPVDEDGCHGHLLQLRDLVEVRHAEHDLLLASQMHSISRLYRSMAHDLRSPLNAMVVNLELLGDAVAPGADKPDVAQRRQRYVRVLKEEMQRLNRLLLAFLTQTSPVLDSRRRFDLAALLEEMIGFVEPQAKKQKAELVLELPDPAVESHGRADEIRSAALSLVVNALEAVEDRDDGRIVMGAAREDGDALLWVEDNGPGVPSEAVDKIFDLYYTTRPSGSGPGLHVARRVAERHGGSLELVDTEGAGARFEMRLPGWNADAAAEEI